MTGAKIAVALYGVTLLVVVCGMSAGLVASPRDDGLSPTRVAPTGNRFRDAFAQWDGQWYLLISKSGYSYDANRQSSVAFFPLYPICSRGVAAALSIPLDIASLLVAHTCRLLGIWLFWSYLGDRFGGDTRTKSVAVLVFAMFPTGFFAFMIYSESLFILFVVCFFFLLNRRCHPATAAVVVALAGATRPVGVVLLLPLIVYCARFSGSSVRSAVHMAVAILIGSSGLLCYVAFLEWQFGDSLAFVRTQAYWGYRPRLGFIQHFTTLLSGEPIWTTFVPGWPAYWRRFDDVPAFFLSIHAMNSIWFVLSVVCIVVGWSRRWVSTCEFVGCVALIAVPYVTRSYEMCMASQGRFLLPVVPMYIAVAQAIVCAHAYAQYVVIVGLVVQLGWFAAVWGAGKVII